MDTNEEKIKHAVEQTEILRPPKQSLATFGTTNIHYYMVCEPAYSELVAQNTETVIREGKVIAEKPKIVTPYYLSKLDGFSDDARRYFDMLIKTHGTSTPGLFYTYRNEPKEFNIVADTLLSVVDKLNADIDKRGDPLASIIRGQDELWDVSLMKFIFEMTKNSLENNIREMAGRGLLEMDSRGVPADARIKIEELFQAVSRGEIEPRVLKTELDRWNLFEEYQDKFFTLFKGRRLI